MTDFMERLAALLEAILNDVAEFVADLWYGPR